LASSFSFTVKKGLGRNYSHIKTQFIRPAAAESLSIILPLPAMAPPPWANVDKHYYLTSELLSYEIIYKQGKRGVKNNAKHECLKQLFVEFEEEFPGHIEAMELPRVG
jgi:hypothetical protein